MKISQRSIPADAHAVFSWNSTRAASAVVVELFCAINGWAQIEAYVDGIAGHLASNDPAALVNFRAEKGWDRRAEALLKLVVKERPDRQDVVAALLSVVKDAADIRNEVAHGVWAEDSAHPHTLLLYANSTFGDIAAHVSVPNADQTTPALIAELSKAGCVVGLSEALAASRVIELAYELMHAAFLAFFQPERDRTGKGFADKWADLESHPEIAARAKSRAVTRRREEKQRRRNTAGEAVRIDTPRAQPVRALVSNEQASSDIPPESSERVALGGGERDCSGQAATSYTRKVADLDKGEKREDGVGPGG